jgi:hypothetical protein
MSLRNPDNGNIINGSSTVDSAFRSQRYRRCFVDEGTMIRQFRELMDSIGSVSNANCSAATPRGSAHHFARMWHGDVVGITRWGDPEPKPGWLGVLCTADMDPRKDAAWHERNRPPGLMTPEQYAQEVLVDFTASAPGQIWPEWGEHLVYDWDEWTEVEPYLGRAQIIEAWDFGVSPSLTAVVWAAYVKQTDTLYLLDYRSWHATAADEIARDVGEAGWYCDSCPGGRKPDLRVGDEAMRIRDPMLRSWRKHLAQHGIYLASRHMRSREESIMRIRQKIRQERILAAPTCARRRSTLPSLVDSISQYKRAVRTSNPLRPQPPCRLLANHR